MVAVGSSGCSGIVIGNSRYIAVVVIGSYGSSGSSGCSGSNLNCVL